MKAAWFALTISMLLAACATTPAPATDASLFKDSLFDAPSERISADDVFAPSAEMLRYLETDIAAAEKAKGRQRGLFDALYKKGALQLDYDASSTRNASEAFAARSGNCLSLVLMTAAFAKRMGLPVRYQSVYTREAWSRGNGLDYLNGHVNVTLGMLRMPDSGGKMDEGGLQIDFIPLEENEFQRLRVLEEKTIVAMYMNNRAVEMLAEGELDRAYWWAKAAIGQDVGFLGATNTLAVIYKARGARDESERALRWLLRLEPDNIVALDNLVRVLQSRGDAEESARLAARLKELRPIPPFYFYDFGLEALKRRDYSRAKEMFLREMRRDASYDKFHASLALAYYGLGDVDNAQAQLVLALDHATTTAERQSYAETLSRLKAGQHP